METTLKRDRAATRSRVKVRSARDTNDILGTNLKKNYLVILLIVRYTKEYL